MLDEDGKVPEWTERLRMCVPFIEALRYMYTESESHTVVEISSNLQASVTTPIIEH